MIPAKDILLPVCFFFQFCDTSYMYLVELWPNSPYSLCAGLERFLTLKLRSQIGTNCLRWCLAENDVFWIGNRF